MAVECDRGSEVSATPVRQMTDLHVVDAEEAVKIPVIDLNDMIDHLDSRSTR